MVTPSRTDNVDCPSDDNPCFTAMWIGLAFGTLNGLIWAGGIWFTYWLVTR